MISRMHRKAGHNYNTVLQEADEVIGSTTPADDPRRHHLDSETTLPSFTNASDSSSITSGTVSMMSRTSIGTSLDASNHSKSSVSSDYTLAQHLSHPEWSRVLSYTNSGLARSIRSSSYRPTSSSRESGGNLGHLHKDVDCISLGRSPMYNWFTN